MGLGPGATTEENCLCRPNGFGCISILPVHNIQNWEESSKLFTHEIGHAVGAWHHDDDYYADDNNMFMWPIVQPTANIWSPAARKQVRETDNKCLDMNLIRKNEEPFGKPNVCFLACFSFLKKAMPYNDYEQMRRLINFYNQQNLKRNNVW